MCGLSGRVVWATHRADGPAVLCDDHEGCLCRGWHVSKNTVLDKPTTERIRKEENQTDRTRGAHAADGRVENFVQEAVLKPFDSYRDSTLLKVDTAEKRGHWQDGGWTEVPLALAFLKVICPSTQKAYFLRVEPDVENAKVALESTLPGYTRDWERDLVAET